MTEKPDAAASSSDFEFESLRLARNYRAAVLGEFAGAARGDLLEVGAGIGQNTECLLRWPGLKRIVSIEPEPRFWAEFRKRFPAHPLFERVNELEQGARWDAILSVNVLEHIRDDRGELATYRRLLAPGGRLCLFVPARQEIYAPLDKDFGHQRRYGRADLKGKLEEAGFRILRLHYFNLPGYFAWWLNHRLRKKRHFSPGAVWMFDRVIFPPFHALERRVLRPPLGQSLVAIAAGE
jgi:SAM-dependent methyltransferase